MVAHLESKEFDFTPFHHLILVGRKIMHNRDEHEKIEWIYGLSACTYYAYCIGFLALICSLNYLMISLHNLGISKEFRIVRDNRVNRNTVKPALPHLAISTNELSTTVSKTGYASFILLFFFVFSSFSLFVLYSLLSIFCFTLYKYTSISHDCPCFGIKLNCKQWLERNEGAFSG